MLNTLPSGLVVNTPNELSGTCDGGIITAVAGSSTISLSGATLPVSGSCTFSVKVLGTKAGTFTNVVTAGSMNGGSGTPGTATLTVSAPAGGIKLKKMFEHDSVPSGDPVTVTFTIINQSGGTLTGLAFTDTFPPHMTSTGLLSNSCGAVGSASYRWQCAHVQRRDCDSGARRVVLHRRRSHG